MAAYQDGLYLYTWPDCLKPSLPRHLSEVLVLMLEGQTTKEIVQTLGKSENTVHAYKSSLILRFGVQTSEQVVAVAAVRFWLYKLGELGVPLCR